MVITLQSIADIIDDWVISGPSAKTCGEGARKRFDIVVFNYRKLDSFFKNFDKITNFNKELDRITVVSCSPCASERKSIEEYTGQGIQVRYLPRRNFGMAEYARLEYFREGSEFNDFGYSFTFQMQDHYLDTESACSKWGPELDFGVKGDVVPDDMSFDLDRLEQLFNENAIDCMYCDRNDPCYFEIAGGKFIAPNGGNFLFRTTMLSDKKMQSLLSKLMLTCDNSYNWAVFMEFMYGMLFFQEGRRIFDLKRNQAVSSYDARLFYLAPDNFSALYTKYTKGKQSQFRTLTRLLRICTDKLRLNK